LFTDTSCVRSRLLAIVALLLASCLGSPAVANCPLERLAERVFVAGDAKKPITFGYELEFVPEKALGLLEYYKTFEFSDATWKALPREKRLAHAKEAVAKRSLRTVALIKMAGAPDFLSRTLTVEANGRVELSSNAIEESVDGTVNRLEWVFEHLGPASIQAHAAFREKGFSEMAPGAHNFMRADFDLGQTEALAKGYESYLSKGTIPGRNLSHPSLGVPDSITQARSLDSLTKGKSTRAVDAEAKLIYGTVFRPDLYGNDKIGFEIRSCHNRIPCIRKKLERLTSRLSRSFDSYVALHDEVVVSSELFQRLPDDVREVFHEAGETAARNGIDSATGGAPYEQRFMYPLLPWEDRVLLRGLTPKGFEVFKVKNGAAQAEFIRRVRELGASKIAGNELLDQLQIAVAKWAHESGMASWLKSGEEGLETQHSLFGSVTKKVLDLKLELEPDVYIELLRSKDASAAIAHNVGELSRVNRAWVINLMNRKGLKTTANGPSGGLLQNSIASNDPVRLGRLIDAARANGRLSDLETMLTAQFASRVSSQYDDPQAGLDAAAVIAGKADAKTRSRAFNALKTSSAKSALPAEYDFNQLVLAHAVDALQPLSDSRILVKYGEEQAIVSLNSRASTLSIKPVDAWEFEKLRTKAKQYQAEMLTRAKIRVSDLDLIAEHKRNPEAIYLISATGIHHQGILVGNTVYSISSGAGVSRVPLSKWVGMWGDTTLVRLKTGAKERAVLQADLEKQVGVPADFAIQASQGSVNCTNMVADSLKRAGILEMPNEYTRSDSKGQIEYITGHAKELATVDAILMRKVPEPSALDWAKAFGTVMGSMLAAATVPIGVVELLSVGRDDEQEGRLPLDGRAEIAEDGSGIRLYPRRSGKASGLHAGDILIAIDGRPVSFSKLLRDLEGERHRALVVGVRYLRALAPDAQTGRRELTCPPPTLFAVSILT
jgi:hypothetical protein